MTTFNLEEITQKLSDIKGAQGNIAEEKALGERLSELQGSRNHLSKVQGKINTLKQAAREGGDNISIPFKPNIVQFQSIQNQLQDRLDKFDQDPTNENFMGGNKWNRIAKVAGYNFRMTDIQAAMGIKQLEKLDWMLEERRNIAELKLHHQK
mgnify:CR=1 FL=1